MRVFEPSRFAKLPDAVLFDLDNTFYDYTPAHAAAQSAVRAKVITTFSLEGKDFDVAYAKARMQVKQRLENTAASHSRLLYLQKMLEIMGLGSQILLALDFEQTYWRTFLSHAVVFDEAFEFLDDLRLLGIPTAIVTDLTAQIQFRKLVYLGLDHYFDCVVTSEEAGFEKPHRAPFEIALEKLRLDHANIWMIGDHCIRDIGGARQHLQAATLQKLHPGVSLGQKTYRPDAAFDLFSQVRSLLDRLAKP